MKRRLFDSKFDSGGKIVNQLDLEGSAHWHRCQAGQRGFSGHGWWIPPTVNSAPLGCDPPVAIKLWLADKLGPSGCCIQALTAAVRNAGGPRRWGQLTKHSNYETTKGMTASKPACTVVRQRPIAATF